jgi:phosphohistidine phosphatase
MRRLILLRHSKAVPHTGRDDHGRALTEGGREDAERIGQFLARKGLIPDLVVYSSAERTRETAKIVAENWGRRVKNISENGLYEATRDAILARVQGLPDRAGAVMIVGHNPGIAEIANIFAGSGAEDDRLRMAGKFPTSAFAVIDFPVQKWADAAPRKGRLERFTAPSDFALKRA